MALSVQFFAFNRSIADELTARIQKLARGELEIKTPSSYQERIYAAAHTGRGSYIVKAVAGSGKTTTGIGMLSHFPGVDMANIRASTFHSAGHGALAKKLGVRSNELNVKGNKVRNLIQEYMSERDQGYYADYVAKIVSFAKGVGVGVLVPDSMDTWWGLARHHDLYLDTLEDGVTEERAIELAQDMLQRSTKAAEANFFDFDDQLYLPLLWKLRLWQNDVVVIDEAQDTNPVRRALAKAALKPGGRLFAFGDPKQAIYGFTGASHDAMDLIRDEFDCAELPLTVCYRCAQSIVAEAQEDVSYIEAHDAAPEGTVATMPIAEALEALGPQDAILCRQTAPLVSLAMYCIARGRAAQVMGREIGTGLISLIRKMKANDVDGLETLLNNYRDREVTKFLSRGEESKAESVHDRVDCIFAVIEQVPENERSVAAVIARIETLFSDGSKHVLTLGTVHKAKGREWPRVGILRPDLIPSQWARQSWQVDQEYNVRYVARTRAQLWLIYIAGDVKDLRHRRAAGEAA